MGVEKPVKSVYLDYEGSKPTDPRVVQAMLPYFTEIYGNPSSPHSHGYTARLAMEEARSKVASLLNAASSKEVVFTGNATEGNNLAIRGTCLRNRAAGSHIVLSAIEHISILNITRLLEKEGFQVTRVPVDSSGLVDPEKLGGAIRKETLMVSVQYANPEIGTVQPIREVGAICRERDVYFHCDAVDAVGHIPVDVQKDAIDLLTLSSNDFYGPKGIGALYIKTGTKIEPVLQGGGQERGLRSGTEDIPSIIGMGRAAEIAREEMEKDRVRLTGLRDRLIESALSIPKTRLTGHPTRRLPWHASLIFDAVEGEALTLNLNDRGIVANTGSSCSSKTLAPSHVLHGIGLNEVQAHGSLILGMGRWTTAEDVAYVAEQLPDVLEKLRRLSPLWGREYKALYEKGMQAEEEFKRRVLEAEKNAGK